MSREERAIQYAKLAMMVCFLLIVILVLLFGRMQCSIA